MGFSILIAEDDAVSRRVLEATLRQQGHDVVTTVDGAQAWEELNKPDAPRIAVLDWMMPELDGVELARKIRTSPGRGYVYVILLTARGQKEDVVTGLDAGADDYLTKPFDPHELRSRLNVGERILKLEQDLATKVDELREAMDQVNTLQGLLPICMYCKKIRDDKDVWHRLESYIVEHSEAMFSHALCEDCREEHYPRRSTAAGED